MKNTNINLRNQTIYQVYTRNYSKEGTFKEVTKDLSRIKDLGIDILLILPINEIGVVARKGTLGSPYSIKDYSNINEELGTKEDLIELINKTHEAGMKFMLDIVYNHTSRDSNLLKLHPNYFYKNESGEFANRVGDWTDITDLDYNNRDVVETMTNYILEYVKLGIDGFRCDVGNLVPISFWLYARKRASEINGDLVWLSETTDGHFIKEIRDAGFECNTESEIYNAFDMAYDYDAFNDLRSYFKDGRPLNNYIDALKRQEYIYPKNYVKAHYLENHDQLRIASYVGTGEKLDNWTAFLFFLKGTTFIFNGQEYSSTHLPSLFDKDDFDKPVDKTKYFKMLIKLKKDKAFSEGIYHLEYTNIDEVYTISYETSSSIYFGLFNLNDKEGIVGVPLLDGTYKNLYDGLKSIVVNSELKLTKKPLIVKIEK